MYGYNQGPPVPYHPPYSEYQKGSPGNNMYYSYGSQLNTATPPPVYGYGMHQDHWQNQPQGQQPGQQQQHSQVSQAQQPGQPLTQQVGQSQLPGQPGQPGVGQGQLPGQVPGQPVGQGQLPGQVPGQAPGPYYSYPYPYQPPAPAPQYHLPAITDPTGQTAPPGAKPKVTTTLWEDEGTLCFQVEARSICVARREDNDMINGTKLLNVAGMTRGRRDGILKGEKNRHVVKAGAMHLKGVWIPYDRALDFANKEKIIDLLYPLFVTDIKSVLYHPSNYARTAQVLSAAEKRKAEVAATKEEAPSSASSTVGPATTSAPAPATASTTAAAAAAGAAVTAGHGGPQQGYEDNRYSLERLVSTPPPAASHAASAGHYLSYLPPPGEYQAQGQLPHQGGAGSALPQSQPGQGIPQGQPALPPPRYTGYGLPQINFQQGAHDSNGALLEAPPNSGGPAPAGSEYNPSTTPLTDSLPHTPASLQPAQIDEKSPRYVIDKDDEPAAKRLKTEAK